MFKENFLTYLRVEKQCSTHTLRAYWQDLNELGAYLVRQKEIDIFEESGIGKLVHRDLRAWMGELRENGLSPRSIARKLSAAKTYFSFLQKAGRIEQNPALRVKLPQFEKKLPAFLKESEVTHLLDELEFADTFEGLRDKCMLELLYGCGLRRSELLSLRLEDIDLYERSLRVSGKGNKDRVLPFGKHVTQALDAYINRANAESQSLRYSFFLTRKGKPAYPKLVYRIVQKYLSQASSLTRQSPHVLRHTFATHLLDRGADLNAIKELLGHASLASTQVYTHNTISKLKSVHKQAHPRAFTPNIDES